MTAGTPRGREPRSDERAAAASRVRGRGGQAARLADAPVTAAREAARALAHRYADAFPRVAAAAARRAGGGTGPAEPGAEARGAARAAARRQAAEAARQVAERENGARPSGRRSRGKRSRGERPVVPEAQFGSYYGLPVLNKPVWKPLDIAGYFFLGGLAGASSVLAAGAQATGRGGLARPLKAGALGAISLSTAALVHDLGRPGRFLAMLRVAKPTSPMSTGSWLLAAYGPAAGAAAVTGLTGRLPRAGAAATAVAGVLGPAVAAYPAVLIADTAVPSWHEARRHLPFVFTGSAAAAAGGLGLLVAPPAQAGPARRCAAYGAALELVATRAMKHSIGLAAEPYTRGTPGRLLRAAEALTAAGAAAGLLAGHRRRSAAAAGAALLAGSATLRFAVFHAGVASAEDPKYTVVPQRERLRRAAAEGDQDA